jgi:DNA-binding LytR/AlgR family response regulator
VKNPKRNPIQQVSNGENLDGLVRPGKEQWKNTILFNMIDFLKAEIHGPDIIELINHPKLDFKAKFDVKTGETNTDEQTAEYQEMIFIIKKNKYINLQGSLHKYSTNGVNYNDFPYSYLLKTLANLTNNFNIDLNNSPLHNLEYGVNIYLPIDPHELIRNLINYKGETFDKMYGKARRNGRQCVKQQYSLKYIIRELNPMCQEIFLGLKSKLSR